ncbi:caspase domain-containing protein [Hypomontagnella monticulosa]|nr:caspase domain-containing protein [Hypomontagnella monticulosa]
MVDPPTLRTKHWAVLVGISFYKTEPCLKGSVTDVMTMKDYLEAGPDPVDIAILTATTPAASEPQSPSEDPDHLPTSQNLVKKLKRVLENARPGDFVYIHYSGHGTRVPNDPLKDKRLEDHQVEDDRLKHDLALVLFENSSDSNDPGISYFRGIYLMNCLKRMVDKGLLVTLVLDCCYSGSTLRAGDVHGTNIRSVDYNPSAKTFNPSEPYMDFLNPCASTQLVPNSANYTILSACGPNETAQELELTYTKERRGALSYFLIEALSAFGMCRERLTHDSLYEQLRVNFRDLSFFGGLVSKLYLDAGEIHGVHQGDQYALSPLQQAKDVKDEPNTPIVTRVDVANSLTSILEQLVKSLSTRTISVRLQDDIIGHFQRSRTLEHQYLSLHTSDNDTTSCMLQVSLNDRKEYEILDGSLQRAEEKVLDILRHVAKFKCAEAIENKRPNPSFENSFSLETFVGKNTESSRIINVQQDGIWYLRLENRGDSPLYLALFDFTPSWKIENLLSTGGQGNFRVIEPGVKLRIPIAMSIPQFLRDQGRKSCEEVFKIFVTAKPTSFPSMILPEISLDLHHHRGHDGIIYDRLSSFIEALNVNFLIVEDFPQGYPRFSALIASHSSFHVCRRFSNLRVRLLLLKQDRLSLLEKRLESIDQKDSASLSLACCRKDENSERQDVLAELDDAFADYDKCIERCQRALNFEAAPYRTVSNLRNWVRGNGCIARDEIAYLEHTDDLFSLTTPEDRLVTWLTDTTEDVYVFFRGLLSRTKATSILDTRLGISQDPNIHIFPSSLLGVTVYTFVVPLISILLLTPVIICNFVNDLSARLVIVVLATMGFTIALSGLTKTRTVELIIAGAT